MEGFSDRSILLLLMLFFALDISGSALTERLRIEEEKSQENIALAGPEALKLTAGSQIHSIRVDNTGSIAVRIRALYIDHKLICDPSKFEGDAYIKPKESLWILLLYPDVNPPIM